MLRKSRSYSEVYNDLDSEVVNVFRVLRSDRAELERLLRATPYARAEFELAYEPAADPVEQARRTIVRSFMGFGSASATRSHRTGFRSNATRSRTTPAHDWRSYPDHLRAFEVRLMGVTVECREAAEVIAQHDTPETLHYVDPPYVLSTRHADASGNGAYAHEMSDDEHRALAEVLRGTRGMVALSGYACDLYDAELYPDWHRLECRAIKSTNNASAPSTEVLWLNAAAWQARSQQSLFSGMT